ncbi:hypothetical protein EGH21_05310 [Halomicroarcula sp. F13]|uniref:DUF8080 domain-containing protein n=1 Tax=Haloarcula rubra TaxID=2487747 RepID=A0AAW4PPH7_9EURY|nr:hypothetical protein [Halomicroarcula rubra]MBX0322445.1 hypothetical protein [Halomicroarcula rubra]
MVTLDCTTSHHDEVTLVTLRLRDLDAPTRVTVRNCLDGPVWPPRREGLPVTGWTEAGFEGVVGPGDHALGYATPASPADPPAVLDDVTPAPDADGTPSESATDVVRDLGDPSPPADAVPAGAATTDAESRDTDADPSESAPATPRSRADGRTPAVVEPWLEAMTARVEVAESLADADTLPAATAAVREAGGLAEVRALAASGAADERRLREVARRAETLANRRAAATVPVETLARIA